MLKNDKKEYFRLSLCISASLLEPYNIDINPNPLFQLISSLNDLEYILNIIKNDIFKYYYFYKENNPNIRYNKEKMILVHKELIKNDLSNYFYLLLLFEDEQNIVIYQYSLFIEVIRNIIKEFENKNNNIFAIIITSKLILALIKKIKEMQEYDEEKDGEELKKIENNNLTKIKDFIQCLNKLDICLDENTIINDRIDKIYIDIINNLIKAKNFENYDECKGIMEQIEIEKINITKNMYDELLRTLNLNDDYITKYLISEIKDLLDEKKLNFYFILLKYIIKSNISNKFLFYYNQE